MNGGESFVSRWSRRKRASAQENDRPSENAEPVAPAETAVEGQHSGVEPRSPPANISPSDEGTVPIPELPPIESIVAETDVRAFLAPGVPPELTRAALRRAWSADPKIRDFIGLSENAWDFNDPTAMPGFGPLELTDEMRREIARMIGRSLGEKESEVAQPSAPGLRQPDPESPPTQATSEPPARPLSAAPPAPEQHASTEIAQGDDSDSPPAEASDRHERTSKRRHGSALPQ
jgi:Protein of unknown function (DUF3306)